MLHGEISELQLQLKNAEEGRSTLETKIIGIAQGLEKFKLEAQQCEKSLKLAYEDNANNMEKAAALEVVGHLKRKAQKIRGKSPEFESELRTSQNNHAKMLEKVMAFEAKVIDLESKNRTNAEELMHEREEKCGNATVARMRTEAELKRVIGWARGIERATQEASQLLQKMKFQR